MAPKKKKEEEQIIRPATNPESREQQLVNLAVKLAEKQLIEGTASPSVITHFLKYASQREKLEREILEKNARLLEAKAKNINKEEESKAVAEAAVQAMRKYTPSQ